MPIGARSPQARRLRAEEPDNRSCAGEIRRTAHTNDLHFTGPCESMQIEQRRRVLNWSDQSTFSGSGWALLAACGVTVALAASLISAQRYLPRANQQDAPVVELERVVITGHRAETGKRPSLTASARNSRLVLR